MLKNEQAVFNKRVQIPNEPVGKFILSLHCLVEHWSIKRFGTLKEEVIQDRFVVSLTDVDLSERL